jgi:hypothetical protein
MVKYAHLTTGGTRDMGRVIKLPQSSKMGKSTPMRTPNRERRSREYLSPAEEVDGDSISSGAKKEDYE